MARLSTEVCATSGSSPLSASSSPPRAASARPFSDSGTSTHPVNRLALFHSLSPCRSSTSVPVTDAILPDAPTPGSGGELRPDQPELVDSGRREAQQQPVATDPSRRAPAQRADQRDAAGDRDGQPQDGRGDVDADVELGEGELERAEEQRVGERRGGDDADEQPAEALLRGAALHHGPRYPLAPPNDTGTGRISPVSAGQRWADELAAWAIDPAILAAAPESPYGFPPGLFGSGRGSAVTLDAVRAGLPGTVLDVGCGGGAASVPAGAAELLAVDESAAMLDRYRAAAGRTPVRAWCGRWPDLADQVPAADVVVAANVVYNVPDVAAFVTALTTHARRRVVVELTDAHPW